MLAIDVERREGWTVVHVGGEIDMRTAPELRDRLNGVVDELDDGERVLLDMTNVPFADSTTLSVLVGIHKRLRRRDVALRIACPSPSVGRVLQVTGLDRVFEVRDSLDAAVT